MLPVSLPLQNPRVEHLPQIFREPFPWPSLSPTTQKVALESGNGAQTRAQEQPSVPTEAEISFPDSAFLSSIF